MTVRVTTAKGDAGRIVAHYAQLISGDRSLLGLNAATLAGSRRTRDREWPESEWIGHGATGLGLHGSVARCTVMALLNGIHPATGARLGRAFREPGRSRGSAPSVRGFNATFNAPKSVSLLWAVADGRTRDDIIDGHRAAVRAVLGYVEATTCTRVRVADEQVPVRVPVTGITVAVVHLHVSGSGDPQLHSVALITTKVRTLDDRWLAIDARPLMREQQTLSRLYHAALQGELASRLALRWSSTPSTTLGHRELQGVDAGVLAVFSARTEQVATRLAAKTTRYETTRGHAPSARQRWRIQREAVVDSRTRTRDRSTGAFDRWRDELCAAGVEPAVLVDHVLAYPTPPAGQDLRGLAAQLAATIKPGPRAHAWLLRELAHQAPATVGTATEIIELLVTHTDRALAVAAATPAETEPAAAVS